MDSPRVVECCSHAKCRRVRVNTFGQKLLQAKSVATGIELPRSRLQSQPLSIWTSLTGVQRVNSVCFWQVKTGFDCKRPVWRHLMAICTLLFHSIRFACSHTMAQACRNKARQGCWCGCDKTWHSTYSSTTRGQNLPRSLFLVKTTRRNVQPPKICCFSCATAFCTHVQTWTFQRSSVLWLRS